MDAVGARLREDGSDEVGEARVLGDWLSGFSGFWAESLNHGILNGLVLLGKFTGLSPIFHGKIYGFRFRFSQLNQSKKMYCSILTGGMI